jgi:iron complex outermembrane receptor protein
MLLDLNARSKALTVRSVFHMIESKLVVPERGRDTEESVMGRKIGRALVRSTSVIAICCPIGAVYAQSTDSSAPSSTAGPAPQIQEIVVTAQKRAQRLQDVPVSVQVVSGQTLQARNLTSLESLAQITPSLTVTKGGATNFLQIRGVGSGGSQGFDQSVATFVDDVYHGRSRASGAAFLDLERIEVLKGPQSTFFGNNAIAGALNIVSAKPDDKFDGWARALYGQHDQFALEGAVGGPITDTLGLRVAGTFNGTNGWIKNVSLGKDYPRQRNVAGRATLVYKPGSNFDATLKVEASRSHQSGDINLQIADCPPPAPFATGSFCKSAIQQGVPIYQGDKLGNTNDEGPGQLINLKTLDTALTMNYHTESGLTLTSTTGFYGYRYNQNLDLDATPANLVTTNAPEKYRQVSQEVRLTSPTGHTIEYMVGAYYQYDHLSYHQDGDQPFRNSGILANPAFAGLVPYLALGQAVHYQQDENVYSLFGSATWNATDRLKISAGLRSSWDDKSYDRQIYYGHASEAFGGIVPLPANLQALAGTVFGAPPGALSGSRSDHAWMPSAKLQYQLTPRAMAYFSYNRGFKAGGFNGSDVSGVATNVPFNPEYVNAYEVGVKSEWFDRRLLVNFDLFRSDYQNLQVTVREGYLTGPGYAVVRNAATSRSQGAELESKWLATRNLSFGANVTYLDSFYDSFPNASPSSLQQALGIKVQDLSGARTPFSPRWSGGFDATYTHDVGRDMKLTLSADPYVSSSYIILPGEEATRQGSYVRWDAKVSLSGPNDRWSLDVIGKNLGNKSILNFASAYPTSLGSFLLAKDETRNVAVQLRVKW